LNNDTERKTIYTQKKIYILNYFTCFEITIAGRMPSRIPDCFISGNAYCLAAKTAYKFEIAPPGAKTPSPFFDDDSSFDHPQH
jgi:hypothetical protein